MFYKPQLDICKKEIAIVRTSETKQLKERNSKFEKEVSFRYHISIVDVCLLAVVTEKKNQKKVKTNQNERR